MSRQPALLMQHPSGQAGVLCPLLDLALPGVLSAPCHRPVPERPQGHNGLLALLGLAVFQEVLGTPAASGEKPGLAPPIPSLGTEKPALALSRLSQQKGSQAPTAGSSGKEGPLLYQLPQPPRPASALKKMTSPGERNTVETSWNN